MKKAIFLMLLATVVAAFVALSGGKEITKPATGNTRLQQQAEEAAFTTKPYGDTRSMAMDSSSLFRLDGSRLHDLAYESDPALVAFANKIGKTPRCLIAIAKQQFENIPLDSSDCRGDQKQEGADEPSVLPGTYATECAYTEAGEFCRRVKTADHPYEKLTDHELRSLATTSPEAAVILARRLQDPLASSEYYERAVALSGKPGPLEEWMLHRNLGGLVWENGNLDLQKAKLGYEVYLTTAKLGYARDAVAEYERLLAAEDVDLEPIRKRSEARFERMTDLRQQITGREWGS